MVGGQTNSGMAAFDPETGRTLWENVGARTWTGQPMTGWPGDRTAVWRPSDKQASYATPVVASLHGQPTAFCLMRQGLVALEPGTGEVLFSRWFRAQVEESVNAANPVVAGDLVFFSAAYYRLGSVLLRVKPDRRGFEEVWRSPALEMHWATPILHEGHLYGFSGRNEPDARFRCVELLTGAVKWERDESWRPRSSPQPPVFGRASALLAGGHLLVLGEGGLLGVFRPHPGRVEELARWQVPSLHFPCWAGPVLAGHRLYLRSEDRLVCLDLRAPAAGAPH
jgi:outer membrane protein assembly factor BamB